MCLVRGICLYITVLGSGLAILVVELVVVQGDVRVVGGAAK